MTVPVFDFARGRFGAGITLTRDPSAPLTPVLEQVVAELASVSQDCKIIAEFAIVDPVDCDRMRITYKTRRSAALAECRSLMA